MRPEDSNHDGKLSMLDAQWKDLKSGSDANGDGKTDSGELVRSGQAWASSKLI